jgi:hypothetical protein
MYAHVHIDRANACSLIKYRMLMVESDSFLTNYEAPEIFIFIRHVSKKPNFSEPGPKKDEGP